MTCWTDELKDTVKVRSPGLGVIRKSYLHFELFL